jgi:hypothetical protein
MVHLKVNTCPMVLVSTDPMVPDSTQLMALVSTDPMALVNTELTVPVSTDLMALDLIAQTAPVSTKQIILVSTMEAVVNIIRTTLANTSQTIAENTHTLKGNLLHLYSL